MRVRFERHTRIGETVHDQGTVANIPDDEARRQVANGRASMLPSAPTPPPEMTDPAETAVPVRRAHLRDYIKKG